MVLVLVLVGCTNADAPSGDDDVEVVASSDAGTITIIITAMLGHLALHVLQLLILPLFSAFFSVILFL